MTSKPTTILLVDDWESVRCAVTAFLRGHLDCEVIGEASNGREAVTLCEALQPDVVVMDIYMPRMDGLAAIREIHERFPNIYVIGLTMSMDLELAEMALDVGANKVITKFNDLLGLTEAIQENFH